MSKLVNCKYYCLLKYLLILSLFVIQMECAKERDPKDIIIDYEQQIRNLGDVKDVMGDSAMLIQVFKLVVPISTKQLGENLINRGVRTPEAMGLHLVIVFGDAFGGPRIPVSQDMTEKTCRVLLDGPMDWDYWVYFTKENGKWKMYNIENAKIN